MGQNRTRDALLARQLREARLSAGIRQVDVAQALKKPQSFVAKVEAGERRLTFNETLDFCHVIGLEPLQLVQLLRKG